MEETLIYIIRKNWIQQALRAIHLEQQWKVSLTTDEQLRVYCTAGGKEEWWGNVLNTA
jgi:hypothetical protein